MPLPCCALAVPDSCRTPQRRGQPFSFCFFVLPFLYLASCEIHERIRNVKLDGERCVARQMHGLYDGGPHARNNEADDPAPWPSFKTHFSVVLVVASRFVVFFSFLWRRCLYLSISARFRFCLSLVAFLPPCCNPRAAFCGCGVVFFFLVTQLHAPSLPASFIIFVLSSLGTLTASLPPPPLPWDVYSG